MTLKIAPSFSFPDEFVTSRSALLGRSGSGKRLSLDTPLPTPDGWTTVGEVKVGDKLFDENGEICTVTVLHEVAMGDSYAVRFNDGTEVHADAEHLWATLDYKGRKAAIDRATKSKLRGGRPPDAQRQLRPQCTPRIETGPVVRTTAQIRDSLLVDGRKRNHAIDNTSPLRLTAAALPIDAYLLGAWLGDGTSSSGEITSADPEIIDEIRRRGYEVRILPSTADQNAPAYRVVGLTTALKRLGVLNNKHVPPLYLRSSIEQRTDLLRGLMDTDGGWSRTSAEFAVTNERLADDAYELVVSLGMTASRAKRPARLYGVEHGVSHRITFAPAMQVFVLRRKADRWVPDPAQRARRTRRYVVAVDPIPSVPMRCLAVDSPNHLFLCGRQMVPTHNSSAAVLLAELMWARQLPWVTIDPKGDWWGMKANRDGTGPGIPVPVFGGLHGDLPLNPHAGAAIARLVVEKRLSCILDISDFDSRAEQVRFSVDFARALFNAMRRNPGALHLFLEEAEELIPQVPGKEGPEAIMVGLYNKIAKQGRVHGLGVTLLSQRSASINKNSLSQTGTLILFQTTSPNDQKMVLDWIDDPALKARVKATLSSLKPGESWVLSPGEFARSERVHWKRRTTYDSGATPKIGETRPAPTLAEINIDEIEQLLAETIDHAKENNPDVLRATIARLERDAAKPRATVDVATWARIAELEATIADLRANPVTVPVVPDKLITTLVNIHGAVEERLVDLVDVMGEVLAAVREVQKESSNVRVRPVLPDPEPSPAPQRRLRSVPAPPRVSHPGTPAGDSGVKFGKTERKVLAALIPYPDGRTKRQIALLTGYSPKASTIGAAMSKLRTLGYADTVDGRMVATQAGVDAMPDVEPLPTGQALLDHWVNELGATENNVLAVLLDHAPHPCTKEQIADVTGYSSKASTIGAAMSKLRTYGLVDGWALARDFADAIS